MSKVRIGNLDFTIKEMAPVNAKESYGLYLAEAQEIQICSGLTPHKHAEILIHEILHGLVDTQSLQFVLKDNEEQVVRSLAIGLASAIRDNPKVFAFLVKCLK
jgi:hypothetical protein